MQPNLRMASTALTTGLSATEYLIEYGGYVHADAGLKVDADTLTQFMEQSKRQVHERARAEAIEHGWVKRAVDNHMDARSFLFSFSVVNTATPEWQVTCMCTTLSEMIEAEQAARKAAKARENDVMETTQSAAA